MAIALSRLRIALPLIAVLVLSALWSAWWIWAAGFAQDKLAQARNDWRDRIALACAEENWSGYPYRIMFTCREARIALIRSGTTVSAPSLDILAQAYNPQHIIARLTGPTHLSNVKTGLNATARHLPAKLGVKLKGGKFAIATASIADLDMTADTGHFTAGRIAVHARPSLSPPGGFDFALEASDLSATAPGAAALALSSLTGQANLDKPPAGPAANLEDLARALAASGSTLRLDTITATNGNLTVTGTGNATITPQGFISGALATTVNDPGLIIKDMTERGLLSEKQAGTATSLLGLFKTSDGLKADLRLKDGQVYWGPLKLGRHAPLF